MSRMPLTFSPTVYVTIGWNTQSSPKVLPYKRRYRQTDDVRGVVGITVLHRREPKWTPAFQWNTLTPPYGPGMRIRGLATGRCTPS